MSLVSHELLLGQPLFYWYCLDYVWKIEKRDERKEKIWNNAPLFVLVSG
jgi:hypothetical protein